MCLLRAKFTLWSTTLFAKGLNFFSLRINYLLGLRLNRSPTKPDEMFINRNRLRLFSRSLLLKFLPKLSDYLISTTAPASSNCFLRASASSLATPAFNSLGAPSTKSFASFKPRPVRSLTNFTTANF